MLFFRSPLRTVLAGILFAGTGAPAAEAGKAPARERRP